MPLQFGKNDPPEEVDQAVSNLPIKIAYFVRPMNMTLGWSQWMSPAFWLKEPMTTILPDEVQAALAKTAEFSLIGSV